MVFIILSKNFNLTQDDTLRENYPGSELTWEHDLQISRTGASSSDSLISYTGTSMDIYSSDPADWANGIYWCMWHVVRIKLTAQQ